MKKWTAWAALLAMAALAGCETVKGVGRDIEGASTAVQRTMGGRTGGGR